MSGLGLSLPATALQRRARSGLPAEAARLIARMAVPPTGTRILLVSELVRSLLAAGLWAKLDALYMLAAHDAQAARLNWIDDRYTLTAVNSPTFTVDRGYAGTGGAMYLATGFDPAAASSAKYLQNSAHISAWSLTGIQQTGGLIGNGVGSGDAHIYPYSADTRLYTQVNSAISDSMALTSSLGFFAASRVSAAGHVAYREGASVQVASRASVALGGHAFVIGAGGAGTGYTSRQIAAATIGAGLSDSEVAALRLCLRTYLSAMGAV